MSKSNQQPNEPFTKEQLYEWRKFWESDTGRMVIERFTGFYDQFIALAMQQDRADLINAYVGRAAGVQSVLTDIQAGIEAANKAEKEAKQGKD